jgi:hypothetical protein
MTVPLKEQEIILSIEQRERMYWDDIRFNSHRWVEYRKGYYECSFCNSIHTSTMPTNTHALCESNPHLNQLNNESNSNLFRFS